MRFTLTQPKRPKRGQFRIKSRFLLFPVRINNSVRWLEKATWVEAVSVKFTNK
jgi:hypothetical protein